MTQEEVAEISMTNKNQVQEEGKNDTCPKTYRNKEELCNNNHKMVNWKANTMSENIREDAILVIAAGVQQKSNRTTKNKEDNDDASDNSDNDELKENEATSIVAKGKNGSTENSKLPYS